MSGGQICLFTEGFFVLLIFSTSQKHIPHRIVQGKPKEGQQSKFENLEGNKINFHRASFENVLIPIKVSEYFE